MTGKWHWGVSKDIPSFSFPFYECCFDLVQNGLGRHNYLVQGLVFSLFFIPCGNGVQSVYAWVWHSSSFSGEAEIPTNFICLVYFLLFFYILTSTWVLIPTLQGLICGDKCGKAGDENSWFRRLQTYTHIHE